ncbi:short-chain dehydrogenase [Penicillium malachiteum]|uniref:short-chain dehydrogenase n=1 Tax=Penicillium malachiteum TaxID=1324776 RepID=UPI0025482B9E|nr:short-chain dehydrogenase [Penicillium malachiteum]KAJ5731298.1 short-chain dehydrogenase [Penicillium malachiteum]
MPTDKLNFSCVLVTGGARGIGKALAEYFVHLGKKVILVGRNEWNFSAAAKEIDAEAYYVLDVGVSADIPAFVERITKEHPELDCIVNNAGVQRQIDIVDGDLEDFLSKADQEIDINIRGPLHLTMNLLLHLRSKPQATIVNVSSLLAFLPTRMASPVYNGTKAWLHFWTMNLRTALERVNDNIRVIGIAPPSVGTDLHREAEDPDDNKKHKSPTALTIEEFMEEIEPKLERGDYFIGAGPGVQLIERWQQNFEPVYESAVAKIKWGKP